MILGEVGINFAAGMSGGVCYVFDPLDETKEKTNAQSIGSIRAVNAIERKQILKLIKTHVQITGSETGLKIMNNWPTLCSSFIAFKPEEYMSALETLGKNHTTFIPNVQGYFEDTQNF